MTKYINRDPVFLTFLMNTCCYPALLYGQRCEDDDYGDNGDVLSMIVQSRCYWPLSSAVYLAVLIFGRNVAV